MTARSVADAAGLLAVGRFGVGYDNVDVLACTAANVLVFWRIAAEMAGGAISVGAGVTFLQSAFATSLIAFGGPSRLCC